MRSSTLLILVVLCLTHTPITVGKRLLNSGRAQRNYQDDDDVTDGPELPEVCGPYGFRCLDENAFQVCRYTDIDGQTEEPQTVHQCREDMICDEDNIAYCSPRFRLADISIGTGGGDRRPCEGRSKRGRPHLSVIVPGSRNQTAEFKCRQYGLFAGKETKQNS